MLFNKDENGSVEIRNLTGSYYQTNEFSKIKTDVLLVQDEMIRLVGKEVFARAQDYYDSDDFNSDGSSASAKDQALVEHLQLPMAFKATFRHYQTNIVSHEDAGRKVKIDSTNEKLPWEWMLDRDDSAQIRKANETTDRLMRFLEEEEISEWLESSHRTASRKLLINTAELFHEAYPIDVSPRFFHTVAPFILEVQNKQIKKALGTDFTPLLAYWQNFNTVEGSGSGSGPGSGLPAEPETNDYYENLLEMVQKVIPLLTMVIATKRLALAVMPDGVVQNFKSMFQARSSSQAALPEVVKLHTAALQEEALDALDDIKRVILAADPEALDYQFLPENDEENKFFRT
ncbi:MAG: hypothetical protein JXR07_19925 [Reichenbachiella sp.]